MEADTGDVLPRLMAWLKTKRDEAREFVMGGQPSPEEYRVMVARYAMCVETLAQAQLLSRGRDAAPGTATSIMEKIEGS